VDNNGVLTAVPLPYDPNNNEGISAITLAGVIGGSEYSGNGFNYAYTAFIGSPASVTSATPEPTTWAMMLFGVGMIGAALRIAHRKNAMMLTAS